VESTTNLSVGKADYVSEAGLSPDSPHTMRPAAKEAVTLELVMCEERERDLMHRGTSPIGNAPPPRATIGP